MNTKTVAIASLVAAIFCCCASVQAQEKKEGAKAGAQTQTEMPKPGPEMAKLDFLIGSWTMNGEYLKTKMLPEGGKETGSYKAQLGPGGFSVIADFDLLGPFGPEIGHEVLTWAPWQNAYWVSTVGNAFPGPVIGKGNWEGENLVIESTFVSGTKDSHIRAVYSNIAKKSVHIEEFVKGKEGEWVPVWKADVTK